MEKAARIEALKSIKSEIREPSLKWFKKLQQELAPKLLYTFAKEWGVNNEPIDDPISWTDDMLNRVYLQPFLEALPTSDLLLVAHIPVGILYTNDPDPNACAIKPVDSDYCPVIAIDWTLFLFIHSVVPLALEYAQTPKGNRQAIKQIIRDCILDITSDGRLGRTEYKKHDEGVELISHIIRSGVFAFVIAHEYGHIIFGHLDPKDVTVKREGFAKYKKDWEREYMADLCGFHFAMPFLEDFESLLPGINSDLFVRACPLIAMTFIACLESHRGFIPDSSTHPPAVLRRLRLQLAIDSQLSEPAWEYVELFDWVLGQNFEEDLKKYAQFI